MNRGAKPEDLGLSLFMFYFYKLKKHLCPPRNHQKK